MNRWRPETDELDDPARDEELADEDARLRQFANRYSFMSNDATHRSRWLFIWGLYGWASYFLLAVVMADIPRRWLHLLPGLTALALAGAVSAGCWLLCRPPRRWE